jgi:hypothetical protein
MRGLCSIATRLMLNALRLEYCEHQLKPQPKADARRPCSIYIDVADLRIRDAGCARLADNELITVLMDELVERGQRHAPVTNRIEIHLVAFDVVP